jgi:UDPglucose 6-dehydrogenase
MNIGVVGMWHLGTVIAGCLASTGYSVIGFDDNRETIDALSVGTLPVNESGLEELIRVGMGKNLLRFSSVPESLSSSDIIWVAYDTPVDDNDRADVEVVTNAVCALFPFFQDQTLVVVSSQLPVGSVSMLEEKYRRSYPESSVSFACLPENLRLGQAISVFTNPDRVVAGVRSEVDRKRIDLLLAPFTTRIVWMSVESAEMTKHAINAFLATSVAFANELAAICEQYGADASQVEKGLKSDSRIGPGAYLKPGNPFAGGTLGRDISYLLSFGQQKHIATHLVAGVLESNRAHKSWSRRRLRDVLGGLRGRKVTVLGLTYKPGTDTLRRSDAIETCKWLSDQGALVVAFDPAVACLPDDCAPFMSLAPSATAALKDAHALLIATEWPQFRAITAEDVLQQMHRPIVLDPGRFLAESLAGDLRIRYLTVGSPS